MGSLTVRKLDDRVKGQLRVRAAHNGRSLEEEVRQILTAATNEPTGGPDPQPDNLADAVARIFHPLGGVDLELPPRTLNRPPPFDK